VLRGIVGPKREELPRGWRRPHNEELHNLYASQDTIKVLKSKRLRRAEHVARMEKRLNSYAISVGKPEGKRPLENPRRRWKDNIRLDV
jgi:hypothetical protein